MTNAARKLAPENTSPARTPSSKVSATEGGTTMATMSPTERLDYLRALSPTGLRYVSAIRGYVPAFEESYTYCMLSCGDGEVLMALAASNPEGTFFGFDADAAHVQTATDRATKLGVTNVQFGHADALALAKAIKSGELPTPGFDFVVLNLIGQDLAPQEIGTMMDLANTTLVAGGILYMAYDIYQPLTPEAPLATLAQQTGSDKLLADLPKIGASYFEGNKGTLTELESALQSASPANFLAKYQQSGMKSNTEEAMTTAQAAGLAYLGGAKVKANYLEFSAPQTAHEPLLKYHGQPLYETLKDFATNTSVRHDAWCKPGLTNSDNLAARFGQFTFAVTSPTSYIDPQYKYFDKKIDFSTPLFTRLINALATMPMSIGDLAQHPDIEGASAEDILSGVMMLVATGIAEPTRTQLFAHGDASQVKLSGSYNQRLRDETITGSAYLAAPGLGRPVYGSPVIVLCLKALDAGGITGAEDLVDNWLQNANATVKAEIPADLTDAVARRNTAFRLLEQVCQEWLAFCIVYGIMTQPAE